MSIDLQKAPECATHFHYGNFKYSSHWYKEGYFCVVGFEDKGWKKDFDPIPKDQYVELYPQPKPWSGPEDGLPPVGIACERRFPSVTASSWQGGIILAHGSKKIFFRDNCGDEWAHSFDDVEFRAFRTTAQIAAEKRETATREIMDVADVDCRVTAARLVDAGFKREVV